MGKAFRRLEKQVQGRNPGRTRYVPFPVRVSELEVAVLELMAYLAVQIATDPESPPDQALTEAYASFKKHLEGTVT